MIESKSNITIRAMERSDLEIVHKWRNNPYFRQFFREHRDLTMDHKISWFEKMNSDDRFYMFVIECIKSRDVIGVAGLTYIDWVNRHADVHFYIGKDNKWIDDYYSPGAISALIDYGFKTINMNKLWAEVYEIDNKKLDFYKGLGFKIDASLREHYYHNGKYITSHILSLLKSEYKK
mgnify:FL=1